MDLKESIEILQSLALGADPETGEMLPAETVLNAPNVHSALLVAIHALETQQAQTQGEAIPEDQIEKAVEALAAGEYTATPTQLTGFFLGNRNFKKGNAQEHALYGRYDGVFSKGQLLDFFNRRKEERKLQEQPWLAIDFFEQPKFNRLSEKAVEQLQERVDGIPIQRNDLPPYLANARHKYPRSHEPWSNDEVYLYSNALKYTNDLELLSDVFGRSENSVKLFGMRFLHDNPNFLLQ